MKQWALALMLLMIPVSAMAGEGMFVPADGLALPQDVELTDLSGQTVRLDDLKERVVVLHFWATWCLPCVDEMPQLHAFEKAFKGKPVTVLCITQESQGHIENWAAATGMHMRYVVDEGARLIDALKVSALPTSVVLGGDGRPAYFHEGPTAWGAPANRAAVERLLEGL